MKLSLSKVLNICNFLAANGAGRVEGAKEEGGSWLVELISWLADAVVSIATVVWGWALTIFYVVIKLCLNLIDILQMFVERLVGINIYGKEGGLSALKDIGEADIILRFVLNPGVLKTFGTLCLLGLILLVIFSIIAIIKQNYAAASSESDGKKGPNDILKKAGKAIFLCLLVPFLFVFGLLGSNAVLASVCGALRGNNDLTIGGLIFTASSYEANKYRQYASDGIKVPITYSSATKVVRPADYANQQDMQLLFFELATGEVYIEAISDDSWFQDQLSAYNTHGWTKFMTAEDALLNTDEMTGSAYLRQFAVDFEEFNNKYFPAGWRHAGNATLNDLSSWDDIMRSIYKSNWTINKTQKELTFDFSSTYTKESDFKSSYAYWDSKLNEAVSKDIEASIIVNSSTYKNFEKFATIETEYYVMADLIDYAIEHEQEFYYVNANGMDGEILWSDIELPHSNKNKKNVVTISEYHDEVVVSDSGNMTGYKVRADGDIPEGSELLVEGKKAKGLVSDEILASKVTNFVSSSYIVVRYHDGVNRAYFPKYDAVSEEEGAVYIICTKNEQGQFIPVTQETTNFKSSFLASDYGGPIIARGLFQPEGIIPKSYVKPTYIKNQMVDRFGNELVTSVKTVISPYALDDTYTVEDGLSNATKKFVGTLDNFIGQGVFTKLANHTNEIKKKYAEKVKTTFAEKIPVAAGSKLLINPNIASYTLNDAKTSVKFYDDQGRFITPGEKYENSTATEFSVEVSEKSARVILQEDVVTGAIVPWFIAESDEFYKVLAKITQSIISGQSHKLIVAKYKYDELCINLEGKNSADDVTYTIIAGMKIDGIAQLDDQEGANGGVSSFTDHGEFIINEPHAGIIKPVYVEKRENLIIKDGEIYKSNGDLFYGKETAKEYYNNIVLKYFDDKWLDSISENIEDAKLNSSLKGGHWETALGSMGTNMTAEDAEGKGSSLAFTEALMAANFMAGLAATIEANVPSYYLITNEKDDGGTISGTITYYDQNGRQLKSEDYKNRVSDDRTAEIQFTTIKQFGKPVFTLVGGNTSNISVADAKEDASYTILYDKLSSDLQAKVGVINDSSNCYTADTSTVTYHYSVEKLLNSGGGVVQEINPRITSVSSSNKIPVDMAKAYISTTGEISDSTWSLSSKSEYDNYYIYFLRGDFNWSLLFDFCLNLPAIRFVPNFAVTFTFRCRMGTAYDYMEDVIYRLQAGHFYLDYNFREANGIGKTNLFRMSSINPLILIFSTVLVLSILWKAVWGLILRIYKMLLLFIMLPAVCSTMPMDDGSRFGKWKDELISQMFSAYGVLIMLNLYFVIVPMVKDVTTNLITPTDLPTTITGLFSSVQIGLSSVVGAIKNFGAGIVGSGLNLIGNIGLNAGGIFTLAAEMDSAALNILGYVNRIIYIMFFLVLTTMLANGRELITTVLGLADLSDAKKDVDATLGQVGKAANVAKSIGQKVVDPFKNLAGKAIDGIVKSKIGVDPGLGGGRAEEKPPTPTNEGDEVKKYTPPPLKFIGPLDPPEITKEEPPEVPLLTAGQTLEPPEITKEEPTETPQLTAGHNLELPETTEEKPRDKKPYNSPIAEEIGFGHIPIDDIYREVAPDYDDKTIEEVQEELDTMQQMFEEERANFANSTAFEGSMDMRTYNKRKGKLEEQHKDLQEAYGTAYENERALNEEKLRLQQEGKFSGQDKEIWDAKHGAALKELEESKRALESFERDIADYEKAQSEYDEMMSAFEGEKAKLQHYYDIRHNNEIADENRDKFLAQLEKEEEERKAKAKAAQQETTAVVPIDSETALTQIEDNIGEKVEETVETKAVEIVENKLKEIQSSGDQSGGDKSDGTTVEHAKNADKATEADDAFFAKLLDPDERINIINEAVEKAKQGANKETPREKPEPIDIDNLMRTSTKQKKGGKIRKFAKGALKAVALATIVPAPVVAVVGGVMVAKKANNVRKHGLSNAGIKRALGKDYDPTKHGKLSNIAHNASTKVLTKANEATEKVNKKIKAANDAVEGMVKKAKTAVTERISKVNPKVKKAVKIAGGVALGAAAATSPLFYVPAGIAVAKHYKKKHQAKNKNGTTSGSGSTTSVVSSSNRTSSGSGSSSSSTSSSRTSTGSGSSSSSTSSSRTSTGSGSSSSSTSSSRTSTGSGSSSSSTSSSRTSTGSGSSSSSSSSSRTSSGSGSSSSSSSASRTSSGSGSGSSSSSSSTSSSSSVSFNASVYDFTKTEATQNEDLFKQLNGLASSSDPAKKQAARSARKEISKIHMSVRGGSMSKEEGVKAIQNIIGKL